MVGDGRAEYAGDDRQRFLEPRREDDRQQLGLVTDLGESDDRGRGQ
jgi:hypothetical protein